ncbi:Uncharacterised protein [Mycobacterium tuberculosis]|uniref:Uncharacterized protein n=1 Tax=Mycobacterium tuberculosis TaxID=1773 RepID=A0A0T9ET10_MYCTX|nr:Uncharacterised protein [Mycobacterium tuberculosis]CKT38869.1 Uncharacterised protein [Mycobacterium tuberculosis]COU66369.1 Uncharacterised protein [Mycobacterium tuberculosis]COV43558.1 Uncharacterised protein [Mycobacterium tuberculosis]COW10768.1 Uncharacterised protein [Mycobacterium tuberculosis]
MASVSASMNRSSVRSLACTSVGLSPCTDTKRGSLVGRASRPNSWLKPLVDDACSNARTGRSAFRVVLIAAITRIAASESPPSSKNESSTPTRSSPSTRAKMPATVFSTGPAGARYPLVSPYSGAGNAR